MELKNIKKAYFDTNIFIYLIEEHEEYKEKIVSLIQSLDAIGCEIFTSEITLAECLVKPMQDNDTESQEVYENAIKQSDTLNVQSVSRNILIKAAQLRAVLKNKLPDSIHLATAIECHCDVFFGNDKGIKNPDEIRLYVLSDN